MSRGRLIPSLNYRGKGIVDMSLPNHVLLGFTHIEVYIASNLNDAQIAPIKAFDVDFDLTFVSPSVRKLGRQVEENNLDMTRFIYDPNDFSTPFVPNIARIPTDGEVSYVRLKGVYPNGLKTDFGPIVAVSPHDFFSTKAPVYTASGNAPDIGTNGIIPDVLGEGCLNIHLPYYSQTLNITNLDVANGSLLFVSFHAGMNPTIIRAGENYGMTGVGVPEIFLASDGGTPLFTIRMSILNQG